MSRRAGRNRGGGKNSSASKLRGAKFQCKHLEGQNFSVHRNLKATLRQQKFTLKIFAAADAADIFQSWICFKFQEK